VALTTPGQALSARPVQGTCSNERVVSARSEETRQDSAQHILWTGHCKRPPLPWHCGASAVEHAEHARCTIEYTTSECNALYMWERLGY